MAILLTVLLFFIQHFSTQPPAPKGIDAPQNEFSAVRAHNILKSLLRENQPHPVGSDLNRVIKERLKVELDKLGIEHQEQKTWACASRFSSCAEVENLIGIIPGQTDLPYLALMAHYDSVPMAPGAGDDGAGVVAILEAARALKLEAPFKHPIMLILTDAEENGLIGAEAFFNQHPLAKKIGIVLNVEGSGSSGSSMVLRTSSRNELLIKSYSKEHKSPYGFSFVKEIFKRMPNDTDFSVVERANIPGIDFAFAGERNHYHTPNDTIENIDLRTIQHHGENILPASRELLSADWQDMGDEYIYGGEIYGFWTQWKSSNSIFICLLATFILITALIKSKINLKRTALGIVFSPITLSTT
ncbi:MAG: M20/M25/M40 family metallo-hydrolase, partial [Gammaproteobacteria bacterium]